MSYGILRTTMKENSAERIPLRQRLEIAHQSLGNFEEATEAAYGQEPYEQFRKRYERYADLTDEVGRCDAEILDEQWRGATPKEGTYSLNSASELRRASLR